MEKKVLFIEWKSFGNEHIKEAFRRLGFGVKSHELDIHRIDTRLDARYTEELVKRLIAGSYYFVFSFNYFPIVAMACKACCVPYVSWTYDSPFIQLYSQTLEYDTNFAFVFDRGTCIDLEKKGFRTYYLPMAAPIDCYSEQVKKGNNGKYRCDISFVGSLYSEMYNNMYRHMENVGAYERGFLEALIQTQKNVYGFNFLEKALTERKDIVEKIQSVCPVYARGDGLESAEWTLANYFLSRRVTAVERMEILQQIGEKYGDLYKVCLFTPEDTEMKGIVNCGKADYYTEAPCIFANSKINLNISLRSILSGIPLRAFDIMGAGGFLITNYQEDYMDFFDENKDFVIYYDYEDLLDKVSYYLKHDDERQQIAQNGRKKVAEQHTYLHRVEQIISAVAEFWI